MISLDVLFQGLVLWFKCKGVHLGQSEQDDLKDLVYRSFASELTIKDVFDFLRSLSIKDLNKLTKDDIEDFYEKVLGIYYLLDNKCLTDIGGFHDERSS